LDRRSELVRLGGRSEQDWVFGLIFWGDMSVEVVLLGGKSHMSHRVTQSHTEKVANNLKTRLFEFGSKI
jgi:hypothetical protein